MNLQHRLIHPINQKENLTNRKIFKNYMFTHIQCIFLIVVLNTFVYEIIFT